MAAQLGNLLWQIAGALPSPALPAITFSSSPPRSIVPPAATAATTMPPTAFAAALPAAVVESTTKTTPSTAELVATMRAAATLVPETIVREGHASPYPLQRPAPALRVRLPRLPKAARTTQQENGTEVRERTAHHDTQSRHSLRYNKVSSAFSSFVHQVFLGVSKIPFPYCNTCTWWYAFWVQIAAF
jgi:hypothetical protein